MYVKVSGAIFLHLSDSLELTKPVSSSYSSKHANKVTQLELLNIIDVYLS